MKLCFDVSAALGEGAGVSRYVRELLDALLDLEGAPAITLFNNHRRNQRLDALPLQARALNRIEIPLDDKRWRIRLLLSETPAQVKSSQADIDIFHATDVIAPAMPTPVVATVHDMTTWLFPQFHSRLNRWYQRLALPVFMRRATQIIADSYSTRNDLIRLTNTPAEKIQVVHLGVDHTLFSPRAETEAKHRIAAHLNITQPYFLAVGTLEPRKNILALLQAFSKAGLASQGYKLVLTGMKGWHMDALFQKLKLDQNLAKDVILTGYLPDALLPDLYAASTAFVYPSIYEGFGLPVLEAMACGTPVITSNTSSLPEIAGDAALLVSPADIDALSQAMQLIASDTSISDHHRTLSIKQAARFTWKNTAIRTLEIYQQAIALQTQKVNGQI